MAETILNIPTQLLKEADNYFNSIEHKFNKVLRRENASSYIAWTFIVSYILIIYLCLQLPSPLQEAKVFTYKIPLGITYLEHAISYAVIWHYVKIVIIIIILIPLVIVFEKIETKTEKILNKKILKYCYLYAICKELQSFITNRDKEHIEKAIASFEKYIELEEFYELNVYNTIYDFEGKFPWFSVDEDSDELLEAVEDVRIKLFGHFVARRYEHFLTIKVILEYLKIYAYCDIKKGISKKDIVFENENYTLEEFQFFMLFNMSDKMNSLPPEPEQSIPHRESWWKRTISYCSLQLKSNMLLSLSWWFIITGIFSALFLYMALWFFKINIDSTIITTFIAVTIPSAIALATYYHNKK